MEKPVSNWFYNCSNPKTISKMKTKIMSAIENSCNGGIMSDRMEECINDFLQRAHRYLQGTFFKFIVKYIQANAIHYKEAPNRWFDGRNEWVGEISAKICDNIEEMRIYDWQKKDLAREFNNANDVYLNIKEDIED